MSKLLLTVGNVYLETNFLGVETSGKDSLNTGNEYAAMDYETRLGGSAVNFATQLKKFGIEVGLIGKTGKDEVSDKIFDLLKKDSVRTDLLIKSENVKTNIDSGVIFANGTKNIQLVAGNANQSLSFEDIDLKDPVFLDTEAVYFGGSFKQKLLWPHYPQLFKLIKDKNIKLFIDPGRVPVDVGIDWTDKLKEVLPFADCYFPNESEIIKVSARRTLKEAVKEVYSWGPKIIAVKLGERGCLIKTEKEQFEIKGFKISAVSTVGAGDVFNAGFISSLLKGEGIYDSAIFANAAAALRVQNNKQPNLYDVEEFIKEKSDSRQKVNMQIV